MTRDKPAVKDVIERLSVERAKEAHKYACVFCGSSDAFHAYPDADRGFFCFSCQKSGDSIDLYRQAAGVDFVTACKDLGIETEAGKRGKKGRFKRRKGVKNPSLVVTKDIPEKPYPKQDDIFAVWRACVPVNRNTQSAAYLRSRGVNPDVVIALNLAGELPGIHGVPSRAAYWYGQGYKLIIPLYDASGALRSVIARDVTRKHSLKSLLPKGRASGLVFADLAMRRILQTGQAKPNTTIVATEGEIDFLSSVPSDGACACLWGNSPRFTGYRALLGIRQGSLSDDLAKAIPDGVRIVFAIHKDKGGQGEKYAANLANLFEGRAVSVDAVRFGGIS